MTVAKFDWDDHNGEHVLDQPEARVLFVFPSEEIVKSAYWDASRSYGDSILKGSSFERNLYFHSGAELYFQSGHNLQTPGRTFHRIIIEDLHHYVEQERSSGVVREVLSRLDQSSDIKPKLYLTYTTGPEVFVLTPDENGVIDLEIQELANG